MGLLKDRMRAALEASGKTQTELAKACEIKPPSVHNWLSGETQSLKAATAQRAAAFLGVNQLWLTEGKGPMKIGDKEAPSPFEAANASSAKKEISYDMIQAAVSGVLAAFDVSFADLVGDQAAARRRIERALSADTGDAGVEKIGVTMGEPGESYGPSRATRVRDRKEFQAEVLPEPGHEEEEPITKKQDRRV